MPRKQLPLYFVAVEIYDTNITSIKRKTSVTARLSYAHIIKIKDTLVALGSVTQDELPRCFITTINRL